MKRKLKGLNIENFLKANEHKNIMLKEKLNLFKNYLSVYHIHHSRYLDRFTENLNLYYDKISGDVNLDYNSSDSSSPRNSVTSDDDDDETDEEDNKKQKNEEKHKTKESTLSNNNENNYDNCDDAVSVSSSDHDCGQDTPYVQTPTETENSDNKETHNSFKLKIMMVLQKF